MADAKDTEDMRNDLEAPVVARHPPIRRILNALRKAGASDAAMSGSGSTVFGLFGSHASASKAARALTSRSQRTAVTRTLNRRQYQKLAGI